VLQLVNTLALFVMSTAVAYFLIAIGLGLRELRRQHVPIGLQSKLGYGHPFPCAAKRSVPLLGNRDIPLLVPGDQASRYQLYFLIPCLNEATVIGNTVAALCDPGRNSRIVVVDDGSDDDTGDRARSVACPGLTVLRRELPDARKGKGAALNFGFAYVLADARSRGLDPDRVLVVVMDADGRLSDGAVAEVLPLFDDEKVGAVQLAVRIRNRATNFLLQFQNHQFWTLSSLSQFGRISTSTVSLGGNGQFARLSALLDIGEQPWSASLTEDLDLSVSMALAGWKLTSTPRAAVDQQGVESLGALVRQRTRWYQGHMMEGRRLPEIFQSPEIGHAAAVEMTLYLLVPWLFDLPWSLLYHIILVELFLNINRLHLFAGSPQDKALAISIWYLLGFWPAVATTFMAKFRDRQLSWFTAIKLGHAFVITNYLSYVCAWRALYRILRRQNGWAKTARHTEEVSPRPLLLPTRVPGPVAMPLPISASVSMSTSVSLSASLSIPPSVATPSSLTKGPSHAL
jgi:1,2-diacylglycerol 3-beta-glucosyltransferase